MQANRKQQGGPANESEATLFQHAQMGCRQSLNLLMSRHEGLIHTVIHEQYLYGLPYEEALQAGRSALWRAILGYEPTARDDIFHLRLGYHYASAVDGSQASAEG